MNYTQEFEEFEDDFYVEPELTEKPKTKCECENCQRREFEQKYEDEDEIQTDDDDDAEIVYTELDISPLPTDVSANYFKQKFKQQLLNQYQPSQLSQPSQLTPN